MTPSRTRAGTEESCSSGIRVASFLGSRSRPAHIGKKDQLLRLKATASLAAAVSALIL